jgi:hypothetical protein
MNKPDNILNYKIYYQNRFDISIKNLLIKKVIIFHTDNIISESKDQVKECIAHFFIIIR